MMAKLEESQGASYGELGGNYCMPLRFVLAIEFIQLSTVNSNRAVQNLGQSPC